MKHVSRRPADVDVRQSIKDIFFTKNQYKLVDDFVLRDGKKHPFALLVPGGGYEMICSFIEGGPIAKRLNAMGVSVFILYYRVKSKARFPAPQDDLARAVREILMNADRYMVETERYSVWGASAGGHLAASFGTESLGWKKYNLPKPGATVLIYPVISMENGITHPGSRKALLGTSPSPELVRAVSVDLQVTADYPPTYIWCGDADQTVSPENTKRMADALEAADVPYLCEVFPGAGHGIGPGTGTSAEGWINRAVDFWREKGN